jgi:hypothetical protein
MHEYKCKKCKKPYEHFLPLHHPCECGGELKELYTRTPCYSKINFNSLASYTPTEFEPVRTFGGKGDIWYWRKKRKPKDKLKL